MEGFEVFGFKPWYDTSLGAADSPKAPPYIYTHEQNSTNSLQFLAIRFYLWDKTKDQGQMRKERDNWKIYK